jgi:hypothetical protein
MDRVIKGHFDGYRAQGVLPPELQTKDFEGVKLFGDQAKLDLWRNWQSGLEFKDGNGSVLSGALDDLLVKDGHYIPFDYKTKGTVTTEEDATKYYQNQLDCYALLLEANQMPTAGYGYLLYYSPKRVSEGGVALFELQVIKIRTETERARGTFRRAVALLGGEKPPSNDTCEYCSWLAKLRSLD